MISVHRVLDELQRQLTKANATSDEATIRESIAAMQSLCGLVLGDTNGSAAKSSLPKSLETTQVASTQTIVTEPSNSALEGKLLEEDDANGGSLFDF